jgi:hypothetical protein
MPCQLLAPLWGLYLGSGAKTNQAALTKARPRIYLVSPWPPSWAFYLGPGAKTNQAWL